MKSFYLSKTRSADSFNLPDQYKNALLNFTKRITKSLGEEILLLVLTGSGGREDIIPGWSDLDVLIVLKKLASKKITIISKMVNISSIKIGTTIYSKNEFEEGLVDSKTLVSLELLREEKLIPFLLNKKLKVPYFNRRFRLRLDCGILPELLHELKRSLYNPQRSDIHAIAKNIDTIMKILLRVNKGIYVSGYENVHKEFYKQFKKCPKVYNILELIKGKKLKAFTIQCWSFLNYLTTRASLKEHFSIIHQMN